MPEDVPPSSAEPKLSPQERRRRREERLAALRLRMAIGRELDKRGIGEPAAVGNPDAVGTATLVPHGRTIQPSSRTFARRATSRHLAISLRMKAANCSGVPGSG